MRLGRRRRARGTGTPTPAAPADDALPSAPADAAPGTRPEPPPPGPRPAPDPTGPDVLELRIHGVNNTAPPEMLDLGPEHVECVAGDRLGSFWRPRPGAAERHPADSPAAVPPGVVREAYSWGGLARTSPTVGSGAVAAVGRVLGRLGWTLLVPFGLVNVAFWTRPLHPGGARGAWQRGAHARALRLVALGLTLLLVGSVCVVALGLVAAQCFAGGAVRCTALPVQLHGLAAESRGARLALLALVPVAVLALVSGLAALSRTRYEQISAMPAPPPPGAAPQVTDPWDGDRPPAVLATPGFWSNARLTATQARLHLAAGLAFVVLSSGWYAVVRAGGECRGPDGADVDGGLACLLSFTFPERAWWWFAVTAVVAVAVLVAAGLLLLRDDDWAEVAAPATDSDARPPRVLRRTTSLLVAALATAVVHLALLALAGPDDGAAPADDPTVAAATVGAPWQTNPLGPEGSLVALVVALLVVAWRADRWRTAPDGGADRLMWRGRAPGVLLRLALAVAFALSALLTVGTGDWLNGDRSAGDLVRRVTTPSAHAPAVAVTGPHVEVPAFFVWFGLALVPGLLVLAVLVARSLLRVGRALPAADGSPEDLAPAGPWGTAGHVARRAGADAARRSARRAAAMAHRAEPLLGRLATVVGACVAAAVVLTLLSWARQDAWPDPWAGAVAHPGSDGVWADLVDAAAWSAGAVGLLVVGGLVGGALTGGARPLGLLWDLVCFLPRTGHPFGPPCYAERVVPELVRRYHEWLHVDPERRVVVSAHSLGAVLAVASVLATRVELGADATRRVGLLTHGTQLRPYFGRLFPELLGPDQLGTTPGAGASETDPDPWASLVEHDRTARPVPGPLRALLTGPRGLRWVSLWRRTDHLGFPVDRYVGSDVDRPAEEVDVSGYLPVVGSHGGYTRTGAYRVALGDLVDRCRTGPAS